MNDTDSLRSTNSNCARVLVVEDELDLRSMLEYALSEEGYNITMASNGSSAMQKLNKDAPDLVLLDWMLPDISGIEILKRIRRSHKLKQLPVIMLTAKGEEQDRIHGLDSGADDYVVKPFSIKELLARIRSRLRHTESTGLAIINFDGIEIDEQCHRVSCDGENLVLGPTEFRLLTHFITHPERVYSRDELLNAVWGNDAYIDERTVDVHIRRLRKALETYDRKHLVQTVHGVGYRFSDKV